MKIDIKYQKKIHDVVRMIIDLLEEEVNIDKLLVILSNANYFYNTGRFSPLICSKCVYQICNRCKYEHYTLLDEIEDYINGEI